MIFPFLIFCSFTIPLPPLHRVTSKTRVFFGKHVSNLRLLSVQRKTPKLCHDFESWDT